VAVGTDGRGGGAGYQISLRVLREGLCRGLSSARLPVPFAPAIGVVLEKELPTLRHCRASLTGLFVGLKSDSLPVQLA
jgi:hypothetical protein